MGCSRAVVLMTKLPSFWIWSRAVRLGTVPGCVLAAERFKWIKFHSITHLGRHLLCSAPNNGQTLLESTHVFGILIPRSVA